MFVTGQSKGATPDTDSSDYLTAAYNAATGAQLWTARYNGPGTYDYAQAVAVSPDDDQADTALPEARCVTPYRRTPAARFIW